MVLVAERTYDNWDASQGEGFHNRRVALDASGVAIK
jgi:hypothetical protein